MRLVALLTIFTSCSPAGGRRGMVARSSSARAEALGVFDSVRSEADVLQVLRMAGYPQAAITRHHRPGVQQQPQPQIPQRMASRVVGHSCHNASIQTITQYVDNVAAGTLGQAASSTSATFLEQKEALLSGAAVESLAAGATNTDRKADLACECEPYECHCQKQCFCRMTEDPFKGLHYPPEANCPVCPVCSDMKAPGANTDSDAFPAPPPTQDYKCSCSFEGIGGAGLSNGGFMECDCKVADCTCAKKCACRKRSAASQNGPLSPTISVGNGGGGSKKQAKDQPQQKKSLDHTALCCKFTDPNGRGPGDHFVWLTSPKDVTACRDGVYGKMSSAMVPGLLNDAGEDLATPSGCRRASGDGRSAVGKSSVSGNEAMARTLEAMCCIYEDSKNSLGAQYVWLTEMNDMAICAAGRYKGRSLPAQGSNPVGDPYTKKEACRDVLASAPILQPDLNQALRAGGRL